MYSARGQIQAERPSRRLFHTYIVGNSVPRASEPAAADADVLNGKGSDPESRTGRFRDPWAGQRCDGRYCSGRRSDAQPFRRSRTPPVGAAPAPLTLTVAIATSNSCFCTSRPASVVITGFSAGTGMPTSCMPAQSWQSGPGSYAK